MWDWLSGLGGNVASGIGNFFGGSYGDPNAYIAGMSSLGGLAGNYLSGQQNQANYHQQLMAQRQAMAQQQQQAGQAQGVLNQANTLAGQTVDPSAYYKPMSDAEAAALRRSLSADLATRGIPFDSSYANNMIAEEMAKTENQRMQQAYGLAGTQRSQQLQGLNNQAQGFYGQMNAFPGTTMSRPNMPQLGNYQMNAFPNYLSQQNQQKMQMDALNKILMASKSGQNPTPGMADTSNLGGQNYGTPLGFEGTSAPTYGSTESGGAY